MTAHNGFCPVAIACFKRSDNFVMMCHTAPVFFRRITFERALDDRDLDHGRQKAAQATVAGHLYQHIMKFTVGRQPLIKRLGRMLGQQCFHLPIVRLQALDVFFLNTCRGTLGNIGFKQDAHFEDFFDIAMRPRADPDTLMRQDFQPALGVQPSKCLANRCAADAQPVCHHDFCQMHAGRKLLRQDRRFDLVVGAIRSRAASHLALITLVCGRSFLHTTLA